MNETVFVQTLASIVLQSSPLIIAVTGETIMERAGVVNLSLDGSMLMAAMTGFIVAYETNSLLLGFLAAALVGAIFALIVTFGSIRLRQSQVAIGFVLTLLGDDLSSFLGQNYTNLSGPSVQYGAIPFLKDLPLLGPLFFDQNLIVYFALVVTLLAWWWLFRTQPGLHLRSVGERPEAAFARGVKINRVRYIYALVGGMLIGLAGASYSLAVKIKWTEGHTRGLGWIALAIVIFGGWSPIRGAVGAFLFGASKSLATLLQAQYPQVGVVFNSITWLLLIAVLLFVSSDLINQITGVLPERWRRPVRRVLQVDPPQALGVTFDENR